jgi:hypothetical protein
MNLANACTENTRYCPAVILTQGMREFDCLCGQSLEVPKGDSAACACWHCRRLWQKEEEEEILTAGWGQGESVRRIRMVLIEEA